MEDFETLRPPNFDFIESFSNRKILQFPHCEGGGIFSTYHRFKGILLLLVLGLFQNGFEQQRVFGQPLHRPYQDIYKS